MNHAASDHKTPPVIFFIFILPFLIFYWMIPFIADHSIGNDYQNTSIQTQMELLFSIKTGSFPLYIPGFASGHSSSALTLGQVYHPLPHIASLLPGYWNGKALECNTLVRLLSLGLAHLALFAFLRKLKVNILFSFLISFITVYNLRMLDLFRYAASLEAYTGHLFLCVAIGWYFIHPTKAIGPISIIGATYWLICSGHPQMMYYGLLGAGLFMLAIPYFCLEMLPEKSTAFKTPMRFWTNVIFFLTLGILLSSAYILPFYFEFIATNTGRVGQSYVWADLLKDTFIGTLNSFFLPLHTDVHSSFGGSSFFIVAALLPLLKFFRIKIPRPIWVIWGLILFVFLYMQGSRTPVHNWVWKYFPFASSFRTAGRITIMMPVLIMMLLTWLTKAELPSIRLRYFQFTFTPISLLTLLALLVNVLYLSFLIAVHFLFPSSGILEIGPLSPVSINKLPFPSWIETIVTFSGMASLVLLFIYYKQSRTAKVIGILLCMSTLVQVGTILRFGTWIAPVNDQQTFVQMINDKREKMSYRYNPGNGFYSSVVTTQVERSFMEPFLGKTYIEVVPVSSQAEAYNKMEQERTPQQLFVEGYEPEKDRQLVADYRHVYQGTVKLVYSSFNRLQFEVTSSSPGFFALSYPFTNNWEAFVNDRKVKVYRANGAANAVKISEGNSLIEFRYWSPSAFWGMVISFTTFAFFGLFVCSYRLRGLIRVTAVFIVFLFSAGGFMLWYNSLYTGRNLGTGYAWTYVMPSPEQNLAYGKKTWVSAPVGGGFFQLHSSRAVDGDISSESGFLTGREDNPAWVVDLHRLEKIKTIVVYESINDESMNIRPLNISLSQDGSQWLTIASESSQVTHHPVSIVLETLHEARYIRVQASGYCRLSLDEVEVYGPDKEKL